MSDEEKKEYEKLKSLLYTGTISQYGKRKLIEIIEKKSKEIEELKENNKLLQENYSSAHKDINWFCENYISKDKLIELREIDNIDLIQCKLRKLLEE